MDDAEYKALYGVLSGERTFKEWPKKQNSGLRQRVYKKWKSGQYQLCDIHDPMEGRKQSFAHRAHCNKLHCREKIRSVVHR